MQQKYGKRAAANNLLASKKAAIFDKKTAINNIDLCPYENLNESTIENGLNLTGSKMT